MSRTEERIVLKASDLLATVTNSDAGTNAALPSDVKIVRPGRRKNSINTPESSTSTTATKRIVDRYADFQAQFPGHFVLMQVGDFFEVYGEDALKAARILDIGLTATGHKAPGGPIPMTGVPVRSVETHVERMLRAGHSVVLCEQFGGTTAGSRMDRRVTRIITPGTLTEEGLLEGGRNNFLLALHPSPDSSKVGMAWIDISTGFFKLGEMKASEMSDRIARLGPKEILVAHPLPLGKTVSALVTTVAAKPWPMRDIGRLYHRIFSEEDPENSGDGSPFDQSRLLPFTPSQLVASAMLLDYILQTQLERRPYIEFPAAEDASRTMIIDQASFRALEILRPLNGVEGNTSTSKATLIGALDNTVTAGGTRLLTRRLRTLHHAVLASYFCVEEPSVDLGEIEGRLDFVQDLVKANSFLESIRDLLRDCKDLERCYQRLALNRSAGGPRDMQLVLGTLRETEAIRKALDGHLEPSSSAQLERVRGALADFSGLIGVLETALQDKLPYRVSDGNVIREGYSPELDQLRGGTGDIRRARALLEGRYRTLTGKSSLRIDEGKLLGFYLELSRAEGPIDPALAEFHLDGQTESKFRYRTSELNALRDSQSVSDAKLLALESLLYEGLRRLIIQRGPEIIAAAKAIAELDVAASMATTALRHNYVRPKLLEPSDNSSPVVFNIAGGRHPVVEQIRQEDDDSRPFTPNDCDLGAVSFALLTGPNMGGKSTFLRQNALIAIMAQVGSFVPASSCEMSLVDAIFTRIGASDDLAQDRSTFMQEMAETAAILKAATRNSLVILDEVGRGTAASEGYSLAWAIAEHLLDRLKCRCLFATHYYELAELVEWRSGRASCWQTRALEDGQGGLAFLHRLEPGVASHSYALHIGRFAGLPETVLEAAAQKLAEMKKGETGGDMVRPSEILQPAVSHPVVSEIRALDLDLMTPRDAHSFLWDLKRRIN